MSAHLSASARCKSVIGNWKMNTNRAESRALALQIIEGLAAAHQAAPPLSIVICPPYPYLALVGEIVAGSCVQLGAQNVYPESAGAYTGEISPDMLLDLACNYVLVGHHERRQLLGESDAFINRKVQRTLAAGLHVILCVGESSEQRDAAQTEAILDHQLLRGLAGIDASQLSRLTIAYEPAWAIGTQGHQAQPSLVRDAHALLRHCFEKRFDTAAAERLVMLYGGSVDPDNAAALLAVPGVDGVLVGGASLNAIAFLGIVQAAIKQAETAGINA